MHEHRTPGGPDSQRRSRSLTVTRSFLFKGDSGYRREGEKNNSLPHRALCASRFGLRALRFALCASPFALRASRFELATFHVCVPRFARCRAPAAWLSRKLFKHKIILSPNQNYSFLLILPPTESFCLVCFNLSLKASLPRRGRKSQLTVVANTLKVT